MIDHLEAATYVSVCKCGVEFTWGYDAGSLKSRVIEKTCACDLDNGDWQRFLKERVKV